MKASPSDVSFSSSLSLCLLSQGGKKSGTAVGQVGQGRECWERTIRAGVGQLQFMINEVPVRAHAVKNLSRQLTKPSELDLQELEECVLTRIDGFIIGMKAQLQDTHAQNS